MDIVKAKCEFTAALRSRNVAEIMGQINAANNINVDAGLRAFDVLLNINTPAANKGMKEILSNPRWNPNYRAVDMWHPEERAMFHHREDLAIGIIKHPNFNKDEYPRVIQSAKNFKANKVLKFMAERVHS